jgi:hypothetical protein
MDTWEVSSFVQDLKTLRDFFVQLEVRAEELRYRGLGAVRHWDDFAAVQILLPTIERKMSGTLKLARFADKDIYERLAQVVNSGHLVSGTLDLLVALKVADTRSSVGTQVVRLTSSVFDAMSLVISSTVSLFGVNAGSRRSVFASIEQEVSVRQTLVQLERTISLVEELYDILSSREFLDEDFFKPSNVDIERVNQLLEQALSLIEADAFTPIDAKREIAAAVGNARLELVQTSPNWRKIIGALVIASTILSGIAAAPQALDVIQTAIKEILGTSIENVVPLQRRPAPSNDRIRIASHQSAPD